VIKTINAKPTITRKMNKAKVLLCVFTWFIVYLFPHTPTTPSPCLGDRQAMAITGGGEIRGYG